MKNRVIWKMFALTIITLGIYRLYWFVKTRREMMALDPSIKIMSPFYLILPVALVVLSLAALIISSIQSAANQPSYCRTNGDISTSQSYPTYIPRECKTDPSILPLIAFYIALVAVGPLIAVWLWGYSKGVEKVTKEKTSFALSMIVLLIVPDGIDILIIQDGFNKIVPPQAA